MKYHEDLPFYEFDPDANDEYSFAARVALLLLIMFIILAGWGMILYVILNWS